MRQKKATLRRKNKRGNFKMTKYMRQFKVVTRIEPALRKKRATLSNDIIQVTIKRQNKEENYMKLRQRRQL